MNDMNKKNKRIGFLRLGNMGYPMAQNLLKAGYKLNVCDVNRDPVTMLEREGASGFESPLGIAEASDILITMLPELSVIERVYLGEEGILKGARQGLVVIDSSTTSPDLIRSIGEKAKGAGARVLDAPVVGAPPIAAAGKLIFLAGGDKELVESCRDIFLTLGEEIIYCGPTGSGQKMKLTNNLMNGMYTLALIEGFSLAMQNDIDLEVLKRLLSRNWPRIMDNTFNKINEQDFAPGFKLNLFNKDLKLALEMGRISNSALPFSSLVREMFQIAINSGCGELSPISLLSLYEKNATSSINNDT